ncbi:MAG: NADH:ubiquinone oxidoreductase subunit NDUFA12 [Acidobacteriia bacterium]|nr:NADH:ubiquinone oxidoreductase subunit NDUFA12 [Methyloceanibacter sp.]MBX5471914.1 NADH:ubiquinone oxidoreductase subunit NDUFA12 [Acetobacteraceae bacterium]MCL6492796.1 NADH:ubiquinone oxidoreductase subunit NDUFA12 [Terriglobia bacterium]
MNFGTRLFTALHGRLVGVDAFGNRYYEERRARPGMRRRRWVAYSGAVEPTRVPPEWHAWLHYITDAPLPEARRWPWQRPPVPNLTGTPQAYFPPGHDYAGGRRSRATGDYEAWTPET